MSKQTYFDYLKGKPLKIDLSGDTLDVRKYDKNNGKNLGKNLIRKLQIQKVKYLIKNYEEIDDKMKELEIQREKWREEIKEFKAYIKESK